jgi:hypothetical protein
MSFAFRDASGWLAMVVGLAGCGGSTETGVERAFDAGGASNETGGLSGSGGSTPGSGGSISGSDGNGFGGSAGRLGTGGRIVGSDGGFGAEAGAAGSAGIGAGGGTATGGMGRACNTLANTAPVVKTVLVSGTVPPALGGTIVSGTYYMTSWTGYGSETACRSGLNVTEAQAVMVVNALTSTTGTIEEVMAVTLSSGGFGMITEHASATYVTSGTTITTTITCSSGTGSLSGGTYPYTATPSAIDSHVMSNTTCPSVETVTRQ